MTSPIAAVGICSPIVPATKRHAVDGFVGEWNKSVAVREQHAMGGAERDVWAREGLADIASPSGNCSLS